MLKLLNTLLVLAFVACLAPVVVRAGDPVPGVDVKLGRNPGGALTQTTGNNGTVIFTGLKPGERCRISFDADQVQKMAINEQGIQDSKNKNKGKLQIVITFKDAGSVWYDGESISKNDEIDITDGTQVIEVTADSKGELRATVNTSRSNIKKSAK
jgi:hypothetical protein